MECYPSPTELLATNEFWKKTSYSIQFHILWWAHQAPMNSFKSIARQIALVTLNEPQDKQKDVNSKKRPVEIRMIWRL